MFGVCSDECLVYAMENRKLWEIHGEKIVKEMLSTDYYEKLKEKEESNKRPRRGVRSNKKARGLDTGALSAMDADNDTPQPASTEEEEEPQKTRGLDRRALSAMDADNESTQPASSEKEK